MNISKDKHGSIAVFLPLLVVVGALATSCATPPSRAFHNDDNSALVVQSWDNQNCQMLQPSNSTRETSDQLLSTAAQLPQHQTAVIILENYTEEQFGDQFRDRGTPWLVGLKNLGYQHIIFLQGLDVPNPEGLTTLIRYD